ncbi:methyltransferase family protein [Piscinibacter sakaiensis]|uniref:methyltransferase family protein n=1 Tax=Piscinibacter sakaiensis TaxID=1547922 RepID=UPI003AAFB1A0
MRTRSDLRRALELRVPPVAVVLLAAAAMWLLARLFPSAALVLPLRVVLAALFVVAGFAIALAGVVEFRRARTTVNPMTPEASSAIVSSGIYRHSRNPMYAGFLLALVGWAVFLANPVSLLGVALYVVYMNCFQIQPEERALQARFGEAYRGYMRSVRRWF